MLLALVFSFMVDRASASDAAAVAGSLIPELETVVQNLDDYRLRFQKRGLGNVELAILSESERVRFETRALRIFKETYPDGKRALLEFHRDPVMRDVRAAFRSYVKGLTSLEALIKTLIHERFTVESFLDDPELGYESFQGFSKSRGGSKSN